MGRGRRLGWALLATAGVLLLCGAGCTSGPEGAYSSYHARRAAYWRRVVAPDRRALRSRTPLPADPRRSTRAANGYIVAAQASWVMWLLGALGSLVLGALPVILLLAPFL